MRPAKFKRFYKQVTSARRDDGFAIELDGRPAKTPRGRPFVVPTSALAAAIVEEWSAIADVASDLPLTSLAFAAIDHVGAERERTVEDLVEYAKTDLVCYVAEAPPGLAERQRQAWEPLRQWARERLGAPLAVTAGATAVEQAASSVDRLARHVTAHDDFRLAALSAATRTSGSLVIALALSHAELGADEAWHASRIDEAWQREAWGADAEDEVRACALRAELAAAARFMALLDG